MTIIRTPVRLPGRHGGLQSGLEPPAGPGPGVATGRSARRDTRRRCRLSILGVLGIATAISPSPAVAQEPEPAPLVTPNLIGLTLPEARSVVAGAGGELSTAGWVVRPGLRDRVAIQDGKPGWPWSPGSSILVSVSTGLMPLGRPAMEFRTTGGATYCQVQTRDALYIELVCWHPRTGRIITMPGAQGFGGATHYTHRGAIGHRPAGFRTVGFGASWRFSIKGRGAGWNCYSNRQALTCTVGGELPTFFRFGRVKGFTTEGY